MGRARRARPAGAAPRRRTGRRRDARSRPLGLGAAARSIRASDSRVFVAELADHLDAHPGRRFALSRPVAEALEAYDGRPRQRIAPTDPGVDFVVLFGRELPWSLHQANRRDYTVRVFGPREVSFNYYPTWPGPDRIIVAAPARFAPFWRGGAR